VFFPLLVQGRHEKTFAEIARDLLLELGYEPVECGSEAEAKEKAAELIPKRRWPCYFFQSDTTGEKESEEFFAEGERLVLDRFQQVGVVRQEPWSDVPALEAFLAFFKAAKSDPQVEKTHYVQAIQRLVPTLVHHEKGRNLDQKM
jgi:hypothetical protein